MLAACCLLPWRISTCCMLLTRSPVNKITPPRPQARATAAACPWYDGPTLFEALDSVEVAERPPTAPFRMPVVDKYKVGRLGRCFIV